VISVTLTKVDDAFVDDVFNILVLQTIAFHLTGSFTGIYDKDRLPVEQLGFMRFMLNPANHNGQNSKYQAK